MADPAEGLEPDITEVENAEERRAQQMEYYGGELDDIDTEDTSAVDRGDSLEEPTNEAPEEESEEAEEEPEDEADDGEDESASDDGEHEADDGEAEDESADDDDSDDSEESEEEDEPQERGIPRHRFNEVNERMKRAEQRLAEIEAQAQATQQVAEKAYDFDAAEAEYMELLLDGKTSEAGAKRAEIRAAEQELFVQTAKEDTLAASAEQQELHDLQSLSLQAEDMFPVFNENSPDYDPHLAGKVVTYMQGYMANGQAISDAFVSGLADVIQQYGLDGSGEPEPAPAPKVQKKAPIKKTKEKVSLAKKVANSPAGAGEGGSNRGVVAPSIEDMSDADLDKLTPEQFARMRGDYIE